MKTYKEVYELDISKVKIKRLSIMFSSIIVIGIMVICAIMILK